MTNEEARELLKNGDWKYEGGETWSDKHGQIASIDQANKMAEFFPSDGYGVVELDALDMSCFAAFLYNGPGGER